MPSSRIKPGITALDISAGGGYTTELLARSIGPTGKVYGQSRPRPAAPPPRPANPEGNANPSAKPSAATAAAGRAAASLARGAGRPLEPG